MIFAPKTKPAMLEYLKSIHELLLIGKLKNLDPVNEVERAVPIIAQMEKLLGERATIKNESVFGVWIGQFRRAQKRLKRINTSHVLLGSDFVLHVCDYLIAYKCGPEAYMRLQIARINLPFWFDYLATFNYWETPECDRALFILRDFEKIKFCENEKARP